MMPVRQNEKPLKSPNILAYRNALSATTWRRNGTPTKPEQTTGAIWPGPCERKGNHGLKSPRRVGGSEWSAQVLVRRYRTPLAEPAWPRFILHLAGGVVMEEGERP
jgi:hypothetical protein